VGSRAQQPANGSRDSDKGPGDSTDRILVVDDQPEVLTVVSRILRKRGFTVSEAADGQAALAQLDQHAFAVVLSDINMPGMDGLQLLRAVREKDLDLPVILMTAVPEIDSAAQAVEYGALRYLTKPLDLNALVDAVRHGIQLRKLGLLKREALAQVGRVTGSAGDRAGLEAQFALGLGGLWMAYQPIISLSGRRLFAYEALLRTEEPTLGNPPTFFETAERLEQLHVLGRRIRSKVTEDLVGLHRGTQLFVNLHPHDLLDDDLFSVERDFARFATRMVLEITERVALEPIPDVRGRVARLRDMGFRIAVDDLGAGFAGLSSLVQLRPDVVKFDMGLVRNIHADPIKQRLVGDMTALCRDMGMLAIAEGIETPAERDTIAELGCDLVQGNLFAPAGRPFVEPRWPG
jgi:EAL domain-containing protein (putative c-di-GMP-specific phosphodiesterase class I)